MIKCPKCGSTAQVKVVWGDPIEEKSTYLYKEYKCGCGCHFIVTFAPKDLDIIKEESLKNKFFKTDKK